MYATKNNIGFWIKFALMIGLTIGIGLLPPFGQITPIGMKILGVFVGTLFGWMFLDFTIGSIVGMAFLGLTGYYPTVIGAFQAGISNVNVLNIMLIFGFIQLLNELNLTNVVANWMLSRKFVQGRPWLIVITLFFGAWLISALSDTFAATLVVWNVCYKVAEEVGYKPHSKDVGYLLTGVVFFAAKGGQLFPFKPIVMGFAATYLEIYKEIPHFQWYCSSIFMLVAFMTIYLLIGVIIKFDVQKLNIDLSKFADNLIWGKKEKWGLFFIAFFVVFLTLPTFIPGTQLAAFLNKAGISGAVVIALAIAYVVTIDGERILPSAAILYQKGVSWDMIFMVAATIPLGDALRSDEGGVITTLLNWLMGIIGSMHWVTFTIICVIALSLLTQVSHNLVITIVLFPVFAPICEQLGGDPLLWFIVNFYAVTCAFVTPAASAYAGLLHSNKKWMTVKTAYGFGASLLIVGWISTILFIPVFTFLW